MFVFKDKLKAVDFPGNIKMTVIGSGANMNVLHWQTPDQGSAPVHSHPQEQFGYVLKGCLKVLIGEKTELLKAGDAYFIPANTPHQFTAIGDTEAVDVFSPVRAAVPGVKAE